MSDDGLTDSDDEWPGDDDPPAKDPRNGPGRGTSDVTAGSTIGAKTLAGGGNERYSDPPDPEEFDGELGIRGDDAGPGRGTPPVDDPNTIGGRTVVPGGTEYRDDEGSDLADPDRYDH